MSKAYESSKIFKEEVKMWYYRKNSRETIVGNMP
jgi:hypothetical protein